MATSLDPKPECCPEFDPAPWNDQVFFYSLIVSNWWHPIFCIF